MNVPDVSGWKNKFVDTCGEYVIARRKQGIIIPHIDILVFQVSDVAWIRVIKMFTVF